MALRAADIHEETHPARDAAADVAAGAGDDHPDGRRRRRDRRLADDRDAQPERPGLGMTCPTVASARLHPAGGDDRADHRRYGGRRLVRSRRKWSAAQPRLHRCTTRPLSERNLVWPPRHTAPGWRPATSGATTAAAFAGTCASPLSPPRRCVRSARRHPARRHPPGGALRHQRLGRLG